MKQILIISIVTITLFSCEEKFSSEKLIEKSTQYISAADTLKTLITLADCTGPTGNYTTEIHSTSDGYTYFKQVYNYRDKPFEAVMESYDSGFQIVNDSVMGILSKETIAALKSHEFHKLLLNPKYGFHQFSEPVEVSKGNEIQYKISALDRLNIDTEIFIGKNTPELKSFSFRNPGDMTEIIEVVYSNWQLVQGIKLPMDVVIHQGSTKHFTFSFNTIKINSPDFKKWFAKH